MELGLISIFISIAGVLTTYFGYVTKQNERITRIEERTNIFWKAFEIRLADMLKSPTHLAKDILFDKFKDNSLSLEETETLRTMLLEEFNHKKTVELAFFISSLDTCIELENRRLKKRGKRTC